MPSDDERSKQLSLYRPHPGLDQRHGLGIRPSLQKGEYWANLDFYWLLLGINWIPPPFIHRFYTYQFQHPEFRHTDGETFERAWANQNAYKAPKKMPAGMARAKL
ncbi:hypothetical protein B0H11DRAFT_2261287 [Mycena galericulata]|nr:hypothetical protein B0H11DRAFT_2261287 [Mycena galericulata]